jgi:Skp family chaperone for outer membrane proteins
MKKILSFALSIAALLLLSVNARSQTLKIGVFDIDVMVQAMPAYHNVDSLMQIFDRDSLGISSGIL